MESAVTQPGRESSSDVPSAASLSNAVESSMPRAFKRATGFALGSSINGSKSWQSIHLVLTENKTATSMNALDSNHNNPMIRLSPS